MQPGEPAPSGLRARSAVPPWARAIRGGRACIHDMSVKLAQGVCSSRVRVGDPEGERGAPGPLRTNSRMRRSSFARGMSTRLPQPKHLIPISAPSRTTSHRSLPHGCAFRVRMISPRKSLTTDMSGTGPGQGGELKSSAGA
jgi:hypothetical protein